MASSHTVAQEKKERKKSPLCESDINSTLFFFCVAVMFILSSIFVNFVARIRLSGPPLHAVASVSNVIVSFDLIKDIPSK